MISFSVFIERYSYIGTTDSRVPLLPQRLSDEPAALHWNVPSLLQPQGVQRAGESSMSILQGNA